MYPGYQEMKILQQIFFNKMYGRDDWDIDQRYFTLRNRMLGPF